MGAPYRDVEFPPVDLQVDRDADGTIVLTPREGLRIIHRTVPAGLAHQAARQGDKAHLCERPERGAPWRKISFAEMKQAADSVSQFLLDLAPDAGRPIMIVSGNSIAHAVMRYGAMGAGVPVCPVSANYALMGREGGYERLRHVVDTVRPAVIFAETAACADAVNAVAPEDAVVITREPGTFAGDARAYETVRATEPGPEVVARIEALRPDDLAAYMLTSGSTGKPKAVIHTHRMIAANLHQGWQVLGRAAGWDDTLLEWLPWSHASGAFSSMAAAIFGGTFYIDGGKPLPGLFDETIENLREIPLKYFTNVPAGYAMLADALEKDPDLRATFFRDLRLMLYGGAGLPQPVFDRIQSLAEAETGRRIFMTTGYGATETTSGCMSIYFLTEKVGIGLPMPGLSVKLVPLEGGRYEVRMKGEMVTPGYLNRPELEAEIRDADGYYKIGDTAIFHDPGDVAQGLAFAGRLAEEFKLDTGTFVRGGAVRAELVRVCAPYLADAVICGENKPYVAILAWPSAKAVEAGGDPADLLTRKIADYNAQCSGSSERVRRFAVLIDPPNAERHEVSDKGTVNQDAARRNRAADVERLYAEPPGEGVHVCEPG